MCPNFAGINMFNVAFFNIKYFCDFFARHFTLKATNFQNILFGKFCVRMFRATLNRAFFRAVFISFVIIGYGSKLCAALNTGFRRIYFFILGRMGKGMILPGNQFKIFRAVIIFYSIFMMHNLIMRDWSFNDFSHDKMMLCYITFFSCVWMGRIKYKNISLAIVDSAANPLWIARAHKIMSTKIATIFAIFNSPQGTSAGGNYCSATTLAFNGFNCFHKKEYNTGETLCQG